MKYHRPRGTQDIVPPNVYTWRYVEGVFDSTFLRFGYQPLRTPIFESTDLFLRSVGEATDIVSKEMYTFLDRGGRSLTLRPENTAAVIRAYLDGGMHRVAGISRLSYIGPMFRYDRPQAGRYRQFHQVGVEAIGNLSAMLDIEVIEVVMTALSELGFEGLNVKLNSVGCPVCREDYTTVLGEALEKHMERLCDDCKVRARINPLRVFDCKRDSEVKKELPSISDHLCDECSSHFAIVRSLLRAVGRSFELDPQLVRGLDYYTKTTFEILHGSLGAQNALCGGGRYDNLVEQCGGPSTPAVGFSAGLERIISVLPAGVDQERSLIPRIDFYVACADEDSAERALKAANVLRTFGNVEVDASMRTLKTQLKHAEKTRARVTVIVGADSPHRLRWKDMDERSQVEVEDDGLRSFADEHSKHGNEGMA
ncbi:MAG: histidine--tRNA ligase [Candidatus Krumholzibacteria bacterium]|nr:histidine--tRNA ligase [Candidatus Krumholzibacteria bacterium]